MTGYVLMRTEDGKFVARSGSAHSYTKLLQHAQVFSTRVNAEAGKCGNEVAISIEQAMGRW